MHLSLSNYSSIIKTQLDSRQIAIPVLFSKPNTISVGLAPAPFLLFVVTDVTGICNEIF